MAADPSASVVDMIPVSALRYYLLTAALLYYTPAEVKVLLVLQARWMDDNEFRPVKDIARYRRYPGLYSISGLVLYTSCYITGYILSI